MGAGRPQRQRRLQRAAWPAGRLPLAAVRGAPRPAADAAAADRARAAGARRRAPGPARHRLPPERWRRDGADRARDGHGAGRRPPADGRRRPAFGGPRADAPAAAAHPVGRRHHVARHHAGRADPQRRLVRRPGLAAPPRGAVPDLAGRPGHGLATINWIAEITVDNAGGWRQGDWNRRVRWPSSRTTSTAGTTAGWTCRRCCAARSRDLRVPDDRPRPGAHLGGRPRGAAGRRGARDVPGGLATAPARPSSMPACWAPRWWPRRGPGRAAGLRPALCADVSALVLRNRGAGPFGLLGLVDERCGGVFDTSTT
jgi:hypothetical protein